MKRMYVLIVLALTFSSCNESRRGNDSNLNETRNEAAEEENAEKFSGSVQKDAEFVYDAVASGYAEIKLSELGIQKASTPEVRKIAEKLLSDHATSLNELKTLAQARAIAVPVEETQESRRTLENLAGESNEDFETEWCEEMIDMHEKTIKDFRRRLEDSEDAELKAFLSKTLPVLEEHREALEGLHEQMKDANT